MKRTIVIVAVLFGLLLLLVPAAVGFVAENQFRRISDNVEKAATDFVWVVDEYERGWFSSKARYHLEPAPTLMQKLIEDGQPVIDVLPMLASEAEIFHGPIFFPAIGRGGVSMLPALAHSTDTISLIGGNNEHVAIPGSINTRLGFFGRHINIIDITEFEAPLDEDGVQGTMRWEGARLKTLFNSALDDLDFGGSIGAFSLAMPNIRLETQSIELNGQQQLTKFGFWAGRQRGKFGGVQVSGGDQGMMAMGAMSWDASIRVDSDRTNQDIVFEVDSIRFADWTGGPLKLNARLDGLDAAALGRLVDNMRAEYSTENQAAPDWLVALAQLQELLVLGPELELRELSLMTPDGTVSLRARVILPEYEAGALALMLANVEATASLRAPASLAEQLAARNPDAYAQLQGLITAGLFLRQDKDLVMDLALKGALLTINGQPMPLPGIF